MLHHPLPDAPAPHTRVIYLVMFLMCLGLQAVIIHNPADFVMTFFGPVQDIRAIAYLSFFLLGVVEAALLVVWMVHVAHEMQHRKHQQECREAQAETGHYARVPRVRGESHETLINATGDRMQIAREFLRKYARPFVFAAMILFALAMIVMSIH
jgi:hypothetical protein